jgi:hypothetical protein
MRHASVCSMSAAAINAATFIFVVASLLHGASLSYVEDIPLAASWPKMRVPKWSHGALLTVQNDDTTNPLIWVFEGRDHRAFPFVIPGARSMLIYDWDRGRDGTIGISGSTADSEGRAATFLAWISADGSNSQVIRTSPYRPAMVAVAPDGTLWTVGGEFATKPTGGMGPTLVPNVGVIRHFDRTGQTLESFVPQVTVKNPLSLLRSRNTFRASEDRIAWYSAEGRFVEISLAGRLLTDISVQLPTDRAMNDSTGFALTNDGEVFLSSQYSDGNGGGVVTRPVGVYILDRSTQAWKPVLQEQGSGIAAQSRLGYICGVDGRNLVIKGDTVIKFYHVSN